MGIVLTCVAVAQTASAPATDVQVTINGHIPAPLVLKADDMAQMAHQAISVPDQDGTKISYDGVPLQDILEKAGVPQGEDLRGKAMASYIIAKAHDGYEVVFSLGELDAAFGKASILVEG